MTPEDVEGQSARVRKLHLLAKEIGLTREERHALAEYVLRRDITSWKQLDENQVCRMLDAVEGFLLVTALLAQRPGSPSNAAAAL